MDGKNGLEPGVMEATAAPARAQDTGDGDAGAGPPLRFSAKRKLAVVQRLLRGEDALTLAWVGSDPRAVGTDGSVRTLPEPGAKRDASGQPLDAVVGAIGTAIR